MIRRILSYIGALVTLRVVLGLLLLLIVFSHSAYAATKAEINSVFAAYSTIVGKQLTWSVNTKWAGINAGTWYGASHIEISPDLAAAPRWVIEVVIAHETAHILNFITTAGARGELAADAISYSYMKQVGYDVCNGMRYWLVVTSVEGPDRGPPSHPSNSDRVAVAHAACIRR